MMDRDALGRRRTQLLAGALAGLAHAVLLFGLTNWWGLSEAYFRYPSNTLVYGWEFVGAVFVGAAVGIAAVRWRLVSPLVAVGGALAWAVAETWPLVHEFRNSGLGPVNPPISEYMAFWPLVLCGVLLVGTVEYVLRKRFRGRRGARA